MAQPSTCFLSHSDIVLARDFGENIPSYLHHKMKIVRLQKYKVLPVPLQLGKEELVELVSFHLELAQVKIMFGGRVPTSCMAMMSAA